MRVTSHSFGRLNGSVSVFLVEFEDAPASLRLSSTAESSTTFSDELLVQTRDRRCPW